MKTANTWTIATLLTLALAGGAVAEERLSADETAARVKLAELETYQPGYGSVVVVGILESTAEELLEDPHVAVVIRDAEGEELGREGAQVPQIAPGGRMPFRLVFKEDKYPEWDSVDAMVWRAWAHPAEMTPAMEAVVEREIPDPPSSFVHRAEGTITNNDEVTLEWTGAGAAYFDADGKLVAVSSGTAPRELAPGESAPFSTGTNTAGGEIVRTEVYAHAEPVER